MREKPNWLYKGAKVKALGQVGVVTECPINVIKGKTYVYSCKVRLEGKKHPGTYHPGDLEEYTR